MCSFRPSCQFLKTICPLLFDPSSIHWTPMHPTPARWATLLQLQARILSQPTCVTLNHTFAFSIWGWLASLLLRPSFFSCAAFISCQIYFKFKLPLGGEKKNRQKCSYILHRVSKLETDWLSAATVVSEWRGSCSRLVLNICVVLAKISLE